MKKILSALGAMLIMTACMGAQVEVPPAHVGKILTKNGFAPETIPPSKFRLPYCWWYCDKLVLLEASDTSFREELTVFMPEDKLNLAVEIRGTYTIPTDPKTVDTLFSRVPSEPTNNSNINIIGAHKVYQTYGQQALRGVVRSDIVNSTISQVLAQREAIGTNIHAAVSEKMQVTKTPLLVSRFELADVQPPKVIVEAQQAAKEREIDIQRAEADAQVELVKAERELEIAKKDRLVEREKAEAIAEQNRIAAESITPEVLAYKRLETAERIYTALANSNNSVIVPADSSSFHSITDDAVLAKLLGREVR